MKPKNLRKKIRRLEARLGKDAKKLDKLRSKLAGAKTAADKAGKKSKQVRTKAKAQVKPARAKQKPARKVKRKLNLSPERRAQLAAAMKARWAAKRAADASRDGGQTPQSS